MTWGTSAPPVVIQDIQQQREQEATRASLPEVTSVVGINSIGGPLVDSGRLPPMPVDFQGWDRWTVMQLRDYLILMMVSVEANKDLSFPYLREPLRKLAWKLVYSAHQSKDFRRTSKISLLQDVKRRLPSSANWTNAVFCDLWVSITHRPPTTWEAIVDGVEDGLDKITNTGTWAVGLLAVGLIVGAGTGLKLPAPKGSK